jgi:mono/diheme cytochrome c family protein
MRAANRLVRYALVGVGIAAAAAPGSAQTRPDSARSVVAGVYTAAQAAKGETVFRTVCANCHASSQFAGAAFLKPWAGRSVFNLFDQISTAMPQDNPGGLAAADYLAVITYILKLNGFPSGTTELSADEAALKRIRFDTLPGSTD